MAIHQRLKNWFRQKSRSRKNGQEETVAVPEVVVPEVAAPVVDTSAMDELRAVGATGEGDG